MAGMKDEAQWVAEMTQRVKDHGFKLIALYPMVRNPYTIIDLNDDNRAIVAEGGREAIEQHIALRESLIRKGYTLKGNQEGFEVENREGKTVARGKEPFLYERVTGEKHTLALNPFSQGRDAMTAPKAGTPEWTAFLKKAVTQDPQDRTQAQKDAIRIAGKDLVAEIEREHFTARLAGQHKTTFASMSAYRSGIARDAFTRKSDLVPKHGVSGLSLAAHAVPTASREEAPGPSGPRMR